MTIDEAVGLMRNMVGEPAEAQCRAMMVFADMWDEAETKDIRCGVCDGGPSQVCHRTYREDERGVMANVKWVGRVAAIRDEENLRLLCPGCVGLGWVSNGNSLRAEAFRLLGETGKVGEINYGYFISHEDAAATVCKGWYAVAIRPTEHEWHGPVDERLALVEACAKADADTRRKWYAGPQHENS